MYLTSEHEGNDVEGMVICLPPEYEGSDMEGMENRLPGT